jgi:ankyrin repeat protein
MTFDEASKVIKKGDLNGLRNELEGGLDPNLCNQYSWTLLMVAAMEGNTSIGRLLIERGADLERRNKFRDTPLSLAAHSGHPSFVQLLLASGASLECHPEGNSFDVWLYWVGKYGQCSPEQWERIRNLFDTERKIRAQSGHVNEHQD